MHVCMYAFYNARDNSAETRGITIFIQNESKRRCSALIGKKSILLELEATFDFNK